MELSPKAEPQTGLSRFIQSLQRFSSKSPPKALGGPFWLIAVLIAVLHAGMAITAADKKSPVFDEPAHLTAGYSYWVKNDFRLDPENGNLPGRWAALPLLFSRPAFVPLKDRGWQRGEEGRTGHQFFYEVGNNPDLMLRQARMMMSIFGVGLCLLIYRCAREFFGVIGGLLAETVAAFDPTMLAHGALVTSDVAAAFFFTASSWSMWRLLRKITPWKLIIAGLSLSGLFLTKFSAPIVLLVVGILSLIRIFSHHAVAVEIGRFRVALDKKWEKLCAIGASGAVLATVVVLAIWLCFSFRYSAWSDNENQLIHEGTAWHWDRLFENGGALETTITFARTHHLLPEGYLYGLAYVNRNSEGRPSFLDNRWSIIGFRSFFPKAFLYKTPLPVLFLTMLALFAAVVRWNQHLKRSVRELWEAVRRDALRLGPLWMFAVVYGACAVSTSLNIGHRHILPIYPPLFIACGATVYLLRQNRRMIGAAAIAVVLLWQIGESVAIRPNYLAYFNEVAGGPANGYKHLVDSSLDWGQDLPALKTWLEKHESIKGKPLYLAYFGTADPRWYEIEARSLPESRFVRETTVRPLREGIYCISATTLQSVYGPEIGPWCLPYEANYQIALGRMRRYYQTDPNPSAPAHLVANESDIPRIRNQSEFENLRFSRLCAYLRQRKPIAQVGYSIFVFDLTLDDVNRALYAPPAECLRDISVIGY